MGIKTSMAGVTYAASHVAAAAKSARNVTSLNNEVQLACTELLVKLNFLLADMQVGDPNIATIQAQITALS